jgi:RNA polymerase sigma factor (sigma-70 family)
MRAEPLTVYIVEDDPAVRDSIALILGLANYRTAIFADAESFLHAWRPAWAGCVVADLRLPGASGLELQAELQARGSALPFIVITGHGDVPSARAAFLARAIDFLEKPFEREQLLGAIAAAFEGEQRRAASSAREADVRTKLAGLTQRENEVLRLAARGLHAKEIAAELGISPRTVEVHKARLMSKLGARNVAELVRISLEAPPADERS